MYKKKIAFVVPCYNEETRLKTRYILDFLEGRENIHLLFVNDGSSDNTAHTLQELSKHTYIQFLNLTKNSGKAEAVRQGILHCDKEPYNYIGFLDADFSTSLEELVRISQIVEEKGKKFGLGSRIKKMGADISRKTIRHYGGRIIATGIGMVTKLPVYDSQCGAKVFAKDVVETLFKDPFTSKWLFDVELLIRYRKAYGTNRALNEIEEIPLKKWYEVGGSKIKLSDVIKVPLELWRIHRRYKRS